MTLGSWHVGSGAQIGSTPVIADENPGMVAASTGSTPASGLNGVFSNIGHGLDGIFSSGPDGSTAVPGDTHTVDPGTNMTHFVLFAAVALAVFYWVNK